MRIRFTLFPALFLFSPLHATPLSFEQRSPVLFEARPGGELAKFYPGRFSIGSLTVQFSGASARAKLEGKGAAAPSTYLRGASRFTFSQFPELTLRNLYPGVDAIFYGNGGRLEYELMLAPRADTRRLRLRFDGARRLRIDDNGDLVAESESGVLIQKRPRVFQSGRQISARYVLLSRNEVEFHLGPHDAGASLKIDPELSYQHFFGGSGSDSAGVVTTDAHGNIYMAGISNSIDFPTTTGLSPKPAPPLASVSSTGLTVSAMPVGTEESILMIGGTPDGRILYAAAPDGIYESANAGASWTLRGPGPSPQSGPGVTPAVSINQIAVDPIDPSRVFLATTVGVVFSSDSGQTWEVHDYGLLAGQTGGVDTAWVAVSPVNHAIVYATTSQPGALFKSTDGGNNWQEVNPVYPNEQPAQPYQNLIATLAPNGNDLFVVDQYANLLKSMDGGASFQLLSSGQYGAQAIVMDPAESTIYMLEYALLQKSTDSGATFTFVTSPVNVNGNFTRLALDTTSNTLYAGKPTMLYASTDGATTLQPVAPTPNLHALAAFAGTAYAAFDTSSLPYVVKWDPTGTQLLYSTFLGGNSGLDSIAALQADSQGRLFVAGTAYSANFPNTANFSTPSSAGFPSSFVAELSPDGTQLIYSDLIGSSFVAALAIDASGAAYITGETGSSGYPATPGSFQPTVPTAACSRPIGNPLSSPDLGDHAFVTKLSAGGSALVYSTFLTGTCGSEGRGIALDAAGEAIVVGMTTSADFPATPNTYQPAFPGDPNETTPSSPLQAGFVTKLTAVGDKLVASSYLGGGYFTAANAVAVDAAGNVALTGDTQIIAPGATPGAFQSTVVDRCQQVLSIGPQIGPYPPANAFVLRLDPTLSTARSMTYLGGSCNDSGEAVAVDSAGNTWVTGQVTSSDFPLRSPYQGPGLAQFFVSELSADATQLLFSSATDGVSLALDSTGDVYLAGSSSSQLTIPKRVQSFGGTGTAAELVKINPASSPTVEIDTINPVTGYPPALLSPAGFAMGIAPGQLVQIAGNNLGPATQANSQLDALGQLPFSLANTTVLFDEFPAALVSVQDNSIKCFAPFEIRATTKISVLYNGQSSNTVLMGVSNTNLQILSVTNADGTPNSATHPASPGSVVVFYVSGLGVTNPLSVDGLVNSPPLAVPAARVQVYFPGVMTQPQFVGAAPGMIAGITQINVPLPATGLTSGSVSVALNNANATVYVSQ